MSVTTGGGGGGDGDRDMKCSDSSCTGTGFTSVSVAPPSDIAAPAADRTCWYSRCSARMLVSSCCVSRGQLLLLLLLLLHLGALCMALCLFYTPTSAVNLIATDYRDSDRSTKYLVTGKLTSPLAAIHQNAACSYLLAFSHMSLSQMNTLAVASALHSIAASANFDLQGTRKISTHRHLHTIRLYFQLVRYCSEIARTLHHNHNSPPEHQTLNWNRKSSMKKRRSIDDNTVDEVPPSVVQHPTETGFVKKVAYGRDENAIVKTPPSDVINHPKVKLSKQQLQQQHKNMHALKTFAKWREENGGAGKVMARWGRRRKRR